MNATLVMIAIVVYWVWCYTRFVKRYKIDRALLEFISAKYNDNPSQKNQVELASALMQCQKYKDAYDLFSELKEQGFRADYLDANIAFCKKPHPFSGEGPKNYKPSYWHDFILKRFGGRRCVAIGQDTGLLFNAFVRNMARN